MVLICLVLEFAYSFSLPISIDILIHQIRYLFSSNYIIANSCQNISLLQRQQNQQEIIAPIVAIKNAFVAMHTTSLESTNDRHTRVQTLPKTITKLFYV